MRPNALAKKCIVIVYPVNLKTIERALLAADGQITFTILIADYTGRECREVKKVTPIYGKILDGARINGSRNGT